MRKTIIFRYFAMVCYLILVAIPFDTFSQGLTICLGGDVECMEWKTLTQIYVSKKDSGLFLYDLKTKNESKITVWGDKDPITKIIHAENFIFIQTFWKLYRIDERDSLKLQELSIMPHPNSWPIYSFIRFHNKLMISNDKGIFESADGGNYWSKIWKDLPELSDANIAIPHFSVNAIVHLAIDPYDSVLYAVSGAGFCYKYELQQWKQVYRFPTLLFTANLAFDSNCIYMKGSYCSVQVLDKKTYKNFKISLSDSLKRDGFLLEKDQGQLYLYDNVGRKYHLIFDLKKQKSRVEWVGSNQLVYNIYPFNAWKFYCTQKGLFYK